MATKTEIWETVKSQVTTLLENNKTSKKFETELLSTLETILAPKSAGSINPPKLDEDGNIIEAFCRFHNRYEVVSDMVMSAGKSKGYCKASISLWNKTNSKIKKLESEAVAFMSEADFDSAQEKATEAKELKAIFNSPDFYDYDRDWEAFGAN